MTEKQWRCLEWLRGWFARNEFGPRYQDIKDGLGICNKSRAFALVQALEEQGYVTVARYTHRGIRLTGYGDPVHAAAARLLENVEREDEASGLAVVTMNDLGDLDIALATVSEQRRVA